MHLNIHYTGKNYHGCTRNSYNSRQSYQCDLEIAAYLAAPAGEGYRCGVAGNFWSQRPHPGSHGTVAKEGYVAIAPALFQRFAPVLKWLHPEDIEIGKITSNKPRHQLLGDIQATIDYLKNQPQVKQDAFGCIGFALAVMLLTLLPPPDIKTASFYGAGIATETPGGGSFTITHTRNQRHPLRLLWHGRRQHPT